MKTKLLFIQITVLLVLVSGEKIIAQEFIKNPFEEKDTLMWRKGRELNWDDFRGIEPLTIKNNIGKMKTAFWYFYKKNFWSGNSIKFEAYMNRTHSC